MKNQNDPSQRCRIAGFGRCHRHRHRRPVPATMLFVIFVLAGASLSYGIRPALAQLTVTETQDLRFGEFAMRDLNVVSQIVVDALTNTTSVNANTIKIQDGQRAEYSVTGGPPNSLYTVTLDASVDPSLNGGGAPPDLTFDNFDVKPNHLETDGAGADTFRIGGRVRSAGDGSFYNDGNYEGTYDFTVAF